MPAEGDRRWALIGVPLAARVAHAEPKLELGLHVGVESVSHAGTTNGEPGALSTSDAGARVELEAGWRIDPQWSVLAWGGYARLPDHSNDFSTTEFGYLANSES